MLEDRLDAPEAATREDGRARALGCGDGLEPFKAMGLDLGGLDATGQGNLKQEGQEGAAPHPWQESVLMLAQQCGHRFRR